MSCGNQITSSQYDNLVKCTNKCLLDITLNTELYKKIYLHCNSHKDILKSIIIDKNSHLKILKEIYKLITNENSNLIVKPNKLENLNINHHINIIIKKEFEFIDLLKNLRYNIPNENLKYAINTILIEQNNIINKLLYINLGC